MNSELQRLRIAQLDRIVVDQSTVSRLLRTAHLSVWDFAVKFTIHNS